MLQTKSYKTGIPLGIDIGQTVRRKLVTYLRKLNVLLLISQTESSVSLSSERESSRSLNASTTIDGQHIYFSDSHVT